MKRIALAVAAVAAIALGTTQNASANHPAGYPFFPFGLYQPYGATYGASLQTPPYFALNPPVYYGARHARPYGISPFASPPVVSAGEGYRSRLRTNFYLPPSEYQTPAPPATCNPCVSTSARVAPVTKGVVQHNPYFGDSQLANK